MQTVIARTKQVENIINRLDHGSWCAVVAPRYSGKTTLVGEFSHNLKTQMPTWHVIQHEFTEALTLEQAWQQVAPQLEALSGHPSASNVIDTLVHMSEKHPRTTYCIILDNLDVLPYEVLSLLATQLRTFKFSPSYSNLSTRFRFVLLGAMNLRYLAKTAYSPLNNVIDLITLPDLSPEESAQAFSKHFAGVALDNEAYECLYRETAGHPYLITRITELLKEHKLSITATGIAQAARIWYRENTPLGRCPVDQLDPCFVEAIRYLESDQRSFALMLQVLEREAPPAPDDPCDDAYMCGALRRHEGRLSFRGRMFEQAIRRYFDRVRCADYWCLHGDWEEAQHYYHRVKPEHIQQRRKEGVGYSKKHLMDLYLGLMPGLLRIRTLKDAEVLICEIAYQLFGADMVQLWRYQPEQELAHPVECIGTEPACKLALESGAIAATAARNYATLVLSNNMGIVQGISGDDRSGWAIQLQYNDGLPEGWVKDGMQYVKPSLEAILHQAQRREHEDLRQQEQRAFIHEIALKIQGATRVEEILQHIVTGVHERLGYECAQISLVFPEQNSVQAIESNGVFERIEEMTQRQLDCDDILAIVVHSCQSRVIPDCSDPASHCDQEAIKLSSLKSQVIVPLLFENIAIGALQVGDTMRTNAFHEADAELLQLLADQAAIAIETVRDREALVLALEATGDATVVVDAQDRISSFDQAYNDLFSVKKGERAPLTTLTHPDGKTLLRLSYELEDSPREILRTLPNGQTYIVRAVSKRDAFGRYAGGAEVISVTPWAGLTHALMQITNLESEQEMGKAIVECLFTYLGFVRARFYRLTPDGQRLISHWSAGMDDETAVRFANGEFTFSRSPEDLQNDGFASLRQDSAIIIMRDQFVDIYEKELPCRELSLDSQQRPVIILSDTELQYNDSLHKDGVKEWLDVPLTGIGKITVDQKGREERFTHQDIEILSLFARWATEAMSRVIRQERSRTEIQLLTDLRFLSERQGMTAVGWHFLVQITLHGGIDFNRAAICLVHDQLDYCYGFLCHGAANRMEWGDTVEQLQIHGDRLDFIDWICKEIMAGKLTEVQQRRLKAFRELIINIQRPSNPFAHAFHSKQQYVVEKPKDELVEFYACLAWEPSDKATILPIMFQDECEGLLYIDRAFSPEMQSVDQDFFRAITAQLANVLHTHRLSERIQHQALGNRHASVTPMVAIKGLAEALKTKLRNPKHKLYLELICAEAQRSADTSRRLLYVSRLLAQGLVLKTDFVDVCNILRERIAPYEVLMQQDGVIVNTKLPALPVIVNMDSDLLGVSLAELAANAFVAIRTTHPSYVKKHFSVKCRIHRPDHQCIITFENSGMPVPMAKQQRIFEPFVSGSGGTGLGLWMVKYIIQLYNGTIRYESIGQSISRFIITLPLGESET